MGEVGPVVVAVVHQVAVAQAVVVVHQVVVLVAAGGVALVGADRMPVVVREEAAPTGANASSIAPHRHSGLNTPNIVE